MPSGDCSVLSAVSYEVVYGVCPRRVNPLLRAVPQAWTGRTAFLTLADAAEQLKVNEDTIRRLFLNEPGVVVICFPRKGKRVYRTVRIPEAVFQRVVTRLSKVA